MPRVALPPALVLALLLPAAAAGGTEPVEGDLLLEAPLEVAGAASVAAGHATLDATPAVLAGEAWTLSWSRAWGERVEARWHAAYGPEEVKGQDGWESHPVALGAGALERVACGRDCFVLLLADGNGTLGLAGGMSGPLATSPAPREYCPEFCDGGPGSFARVVPAGTPLAGGPDAPLRDARATGEGRLVLFFAHGDADATSDGERVRLSARSQDTLTLGAPGRPVWRQYVNGYVRLVLEDAVLSTGPGTSMELLAASPRVAFEGVASSAAATGTLVVGGAARELHHEPFAIEGAGTVDLAPPPGALLAEPAPRARVLGEARAVQAGPEHFEATDARRPVVAAAATLGALGVLLVGAKLAWPLYTRIPPSRVLAHPNRARLLGLVQDKPGSSVADLARGTGLARVVVQYHLRVLQRHGLVQRVRLGNVQTHYPMAEVPRAEEAQGFALLADGTRRRLATRLAGEPEPLTQNEVAQRLGVSRRLACHHLLRLEEAGLVRRVSGRPQRYAPTTRLQRLLERMGLDPG